MIIVVFWLKWSLRYFKKLHPTLY